MTTPKQFDQPCLAFGKRVPAPVRDHEREGAHVPCTSLKFDQCSLYKIFLDHMARHMPPTQAAPEQIMLRAEVVHPPLTFTRDPLLRLFGIGLIVGDDKLDVPPKFLARNRPPA